MTKQRAVTSAFTVGVDDAEQSLQGVAAPKSVDRSVSRERIERALEFVAMIVTGPDGDVYLPIFARLERELAAIDERENALARARSIALNPKSSPSNRRGA